MVSVALALGASALAFWRDSEAVLRLALSPDALLVLSGVNVAVFLWRAHCVADAYRPRAVAACRCAARRELAAAGRRLCSCLSCSRRSPTS